MKANSAADAKKLTDVPNIGKAGAADLAVLGITSPAHLKGKDAFKLYADLCKLTGAAHDPCVIDVFLAAIDFMNGGPAKGWWHYTEQRKMALLSQSASDIGTKRKRQASAKPQSTAKRSR